MCRSETPTITVITHSNILQKKNQDCSQDPSANKIQTLVALRVSSLFSKIKVRQQPALNAYSDILRSQETKGINVQLAFDNSRATFILPFKNLTHGNQ